MEIMEAVNLEAACQRLLEVTVLDIQDNVDHLVMNNVEDHLEDLLEGHLEDQEEGHLEVCNKLSCNILMIAFAIVRYIYFKGIRLEHSHINQILTQKIQFPPLIGNNNRPTDVVSSATFDVSGGSCEIECKRDGGCEMTFNGDNGSFASGSCVANRFGGKCAGQPSQCGASCLRGCGGTLFSHCISTYYVNSFPAMFMTIVNRQWPSNFEILQKILSR